MVEGKHAKLASCFINALFMRQVLTIVITDFPSSSNKKKYGRRKMVIFIFLWEKADFWSFFLHFTASIRSRKPELVPGVLEYNIMHL